MGQIRNRPILHLKIGLKFSKYVFYQGKKLFDYMFYFTATDYWQQKGPLNTAAIWTAVQSVFMQTRARGLPTVIKFHSHPYNIFFLSAKIITFYSFMLALEAIMCSQLVDAVLYIVSVVSKMNGRYC